MDDALSAYLTNRLDVLVATSERVVLNLFMPTSFSDCFLRSFPNGSASPYAKGAHLAVLRTKGDGGVGGPHLEYKGIIASVKSLSFADYDRICGLYIRDPKIGANHTLEARLCGELFRIKKFPLQ